MLLINFGGHAMTLGVTHERGRGRERGRHSIGNRLQALSGQPGAGLELTDREIMT